MKIAVLGVGSAGLRHLHALRAIDGVDVVAISRRHNRLVELKAEGYATAPDVRAAAASGIFAAIVATETARHAEDGLAALEEGLDVLVEKPMAADAAEAQRVCERAAKLGRAVYVGCVQRFSESLGIFRDQLARIGQVHSVRIECQSYLPDWRPERPYRESYSARAEEGGVLRDLIHEIDYAGWLFGWPEAVQARLSNVARLGIETEEVAELTWETPTAGVTSVGLDYLSRPPRRIMRACGEQGTIERDGYAGTVTLAVHGADVEEFRAPQTPDEMFVEQARAFLNATRGRADARLATGREGVKALAVCDAARRASTSRREEAVEHP